MIPSLSQKQAFSKVPHPVTPGGRKQGNQVTMAANGCTTTFYGISRQKETGFSG
jgi:hypothetical protein